MASSTNKALVASLAQVPLFSECTNKGLRTLASAGKLLDRKKGTEIVREGRGGVAFFMIMSGSVDIIRDDRTVARLETDDFFGELALLSDHARNASAVAATDVELFAISKMAFKSALLANPTVSYNIMRAMAARQATG